MVADSTASLNYKRVLIKLSGEALGQQGFDNDCLGPVVDEILALVNQGVEVALVMGGGNFLR